MTTFTPRSSWYHLRFTAPMAESRGGILIPETARGEATEGEVVACGPGAAIPTLPGERTVMAATVGDRVLFVAHTLSPLSDDEALVSDEQILGIVDPDTGSIAPANDWVTLTGIVREEETRGGIAVPERFQVRLKKGRVAAVGPGELNWRGPRQGCRKRVCAIMGLPENEQLVGKVAWWDAGARMVEVRLPDGEGLFMVRAGDLAALEE